MRIPSILLLLILFTSAKAQQFTVSYSEPLQFEGNMDNAIILSDGYINVGFLNFKWNPKFNIDKFRFGLRINRWDNKMNVTQFQELSNGESVYGPYYPLIRRINNKPYLFYYQITQTAGTKFRIMMGEIDTVTLRINDPSELFSIDDKSVGDFDNEDRRWNAGLFIVQSPDQSKLAIAWTSGLTEDFYIAAFNRDMISILRSKHTIKKPEGRLRSVAIDDDANLWVAITSKTGSQIARFTMEGTYSEKPLKLKEGRPYSVFLSATKDRKLNIAGIADSDGVMAGAYSLSMNLDDMSFTNPLQKPIPVSLIEQLGDEGFKLPRKSRGTLPWVNFVPYIVEDGTITLVAEYRKQEWSARAKGIQTISGSLIHIRTGKDIVYARIPKLRASMRSTIGDSYAAFPYKNQLIIFYNDTKKNLKNDLTEKPSRSDYYNDVVLVAATVDADGKVIRNNIIDLAKQDFLPVGDKVIQTSSNTFMVPIHKIRMWGGISPDFKWGYLTHDD